MRLKPVDELIEKGLAIKKRNLVEKMFGTKAIEYEYRKNYKLHFDVRVSISYGQQVYSLYNYTGVGSAHEFTTDKNELLTEVDKLLEIVASGGEQGQAKRAIEQALATIQAAIDKMKNLDTSEMTSQEIADKAIKVARFYFDNLDKLKEYDYIYRDTTAEKFTQLYKNCINSVSDKEARTLLVAPIKELVEKYNEHIRQENERIRQEDYARQAEITRHCLLKCPMCKLNNGISCKNDRMEANGQCDSFQRII